MMQLSSHPASPTCVVQMFAVAPAWMQSVPQLAGSISPASLSRASQAAPPRAYVLPPQPSVAVEMSVGAHPSEGDPELLTPDELVIESVVAVDELPEGVDELPEGVEADDDVLDVPVDDVVDDSRPGEAVAPPHPTSTGPAIERDTRAA
jgi:hypothetical protein